MKRGIIFLFFHFFIRFLIANSLTELPIIYMSPDLAKHISFFFWDLANRQNVVVQTIPRNIYRYFKTSNMGIFEKLKPKFNAIAKERYKICLL